MRGLFTDRTSYRLNPTLNPESAVHSDGLRRLNFRR